MSLPTRVRAGTAEEWALFEDLRLGSGRAFRRLVDAHDPAMRRLVALHTTADPSTVVLHAWATALPGLDMFTWHTSLRSWLFGIVLSYATSQATARPGPPVHVPAPEPVAEDQAVVWDSLAWSRPWGPGGWAAVDAALASLDSDERSVLWLALAEGWPMQEVCDTVGLTAARGDLVLSAATQALTSAVATHLGRSDRPARAALGSLLAASIPDPGRTPDAELTAMFRHWRRDRGLTLWHRLLRRGERRG